MGGGYKGACIQAIESVRYIRISFLFLGVGKVGGLFALGWIGVGREEGRTVRHEGVGVRRADRSICASERPLSSEYLGAVMTVGIVDVLYIR